MTTARTHPHPHALSRLPRARRMALVFGLALLLPLPCAFAVRRRPPKVTIKHTFACVGASAEFSVLVSDSSGPYSFQWYKNGVAIDGDTGQTLVVQVASSSPNRTIYKVVVRDSEGNEGSETADLRVLPLNFSECAPAVTLPIGDACQPVPIPDLTRGTSLCGVGTVTQDPPAGTLVGLGPHPVILMATGGSTTNPGETATCQTTVTVIDPPILTAPASVPDVPAGAGCQGEVPNMVSLVPARTRCGSPVTLSQSPAAGTLVDLGAHTITVTATSSSGVISTVTTQFTVRDRQAPAFTCPNNITVNAPPGECSALVTFPSLSVTDNCPGTPTVGYKVGNQVITSPHTFPVGTTTVTATATDASGNPASCSFTVTVNDSEAPTITCPPGVIVPTLSGLRAGAFTPTPAVATDNCPSVTVTGKREDGFALTDRYPVGATRLTWTATDSSGNTAECNQLVQVHDPRIVGVVGLDSNGNGLPDPLEPRLKGLLVELRDPVADEQWAKNPMLPKPAPLATTQTDLVGNFSFPVAPPGTYEVVVKLASGQTISALFPGPSNLAQVVTVNGERRLRVTMQPGQTATGLGILLTPTGG